MSFVKAPINGPHIYFAITKGLLYVGETQRHPVLRWGVHLQPAGSLMKALSEKGDSEVDYLEGIAFIGVRCATIEREFPAIQHRIMSQAVEHEIHCLFAEHPTTFRLISDTVRTAPSGFRYWRRAREIADRCFSLFLETLGGNPSALEV